MILLSLLSAIALAVPQQLSQQGRLLDANGAAIQGNEGLTFRIFDSEIGGNMLWEEIQYVNFNDGYYSVTLGSNLNYPLDDSVLALNPIYLEVEINGTGPFAPRQMLKSAPFARRAQTAESVEGGTVDVTDLFINGSLVIDNTGSWVGPTINLTWSDIVNIPSDLADGDDDTLASISCAAGEILGWNGSVWGCAADNGLTEAEVEAYVTNAPIDLATGSMMGSEVIVTTATDQDTLRDLSCQSGDVPKWDSVLGSWGCDIDNDTSDWSAMANIPSGFADGVDDDTQLTESQVEGFVTNGSLNFASGSQVNGRDIMTASSCQHGEIVSWNNISGEWECSSFQSLMDADADTVLAWNDCDDNDPNAGSNVNDNDCDGLSTADDCNDFDPNANAVIDDADCDGVLTADDCDDSDAGSTILAEDADCDGTLTASDCNDSDPLSTVLANDADCDGWVTADDCNDNDAAINPGAVEIPNDNIDNDCDGNVDVITYSGTIEMPESGTIDGHPGYWKCSGAERTTIRVALTQDCLNPTIAIYQHASADSSIQGSYYILDESGNELGSTPFQTHGNCNPSGTGGWCTPQTFSGITLNANTYYHLGFQNGLNQCDMSGPSIFTDGNARTIGVATFDEPRYDDPGSNVRGLPNSLASWQNRWQLICQ